MENLVFVFVFSSVLGVFMGLFTLMVTEKIVPTVLTYVGVTATVSAAIAYDSTTTNDNWLISAAALVAISCALIGLVALLLPTLRKIMSKLSGADFALLVWVIIINSIFLPLGLHLGAAFFSLFMICYYIADGGLNKKAQTLCQLDIDKNTLIFVKESNGSLTRIVVEIATGEIISKRGNCRVQDAQTEVNQLYELYSLIGELGDKPDLSKLLNSLNH